ncbi:MAG: CoA transferase [Halomonadaceae bacterium]|nr:MAG: CoA transferase [Halomonadaceae bacterium]
MAGPLATLRVLDFTTLLPGPYATMLLADMGAQVVRVESPDRMDLARVMPPHDAGVSTAHAFLNRGKDSVALNLKDPESVAAVKALVADVDIVIEQFRPGVMGRFGLDYDSLKAIKPDLIYCSITGYGQTGPYKDRAGHDINYLSLAGIASYSGRQDQGPPPLGIQVADVAGGSHHAVMGILAAVIHRQATGEGQYVDVSMTDAAFSLNAMTGAAWLGGGHEAGPETEMLNGGAFYDYYRTADNRWLAVGSLEPAFCKRLCEAIQQPKLASLGLSPKPEHQQQLREALTTAIAEKTLAQWQAVFDQIDACVEPVLTLSEASEHPQLVARDMVINVPRPDGSQQRQIGHPIKFSASPCSTTHMGKPVGADNGRWIKKP